ncbi:ribosomal RNA large subunit methyltransferase H [Siccirubricoccus deserti]|uniref:Ribosomal RNA large subunit methyltransferase H n=1 Tax=Siccirubricoccus deserti TaxID=2013562 RepID=A0A9X0UFS2_9PROT|nr:23S rRNA (pseudouridine(1915)-N(3))-methyltransferase RlmH [Siccirubricoccus deserti]MBC4019179.1 23S rRNA (pseudouridine(1915)-N(3))-methyltransferase RlmH [Siccirubricoccus deserti]GGC71823.1 ribosomal RNA large subunit methyltransferase H [Siccirubricoccus deserti]
MKPARLIAIGRLKPGPEAALFAQYNARLRPPLAVTELPEARGGAAEVRRREAAAILAALPEAALLIALDLGGTAPTSEALATLAERWEAAARPLCFVIGGAEGLDPTVLDRAAHRLSLGPLTWPHFLVRGLLAEQWYRVQAIRGGHPYHRAWRPG